MRIIGGLDVHRRQITYNYLDLRTGEENLGVIKPASREDVRSFLAGLGRKRAAFALEGTTGWRFIAEELRRAGMEVHLAEPAETRDRRGSKRRAKTDRADARLLRDLLMAGNLPESWIPPDHLADLRTTVRLRKSLTDERSAWLRRMHAQLFHHGLPLPPDLSTSAGRSYLEQASLPAAARQVLDIGCSTIDHLDQQLDAIDSKLMPLARRLPGCQVLCRQWGIGLVLAATILAELGDTRRFPALANRFVSPASTSPSRTPTASAPVATCLDRDHRPCAGPSTRPPEPPGACPRRTISTTSRQRLDWAPDGLGSLSPGGCCAGSITTSPKLATPPSPRPHSSRCGAAHRQMICDLLPT
jgi:transposase